MTTTLKSSLSQFGCFITFPATPLGDTLRIVIYLLPCFAVITLATWALIRFGDLVWETVCGRVAFVAEWPFKRMVLRAIKTDLDNACRLACRYHRVYPGGMSLVRELKQNRMHEELGQSARSIDIAERCPNAPDYVKTILSDELSEAAARIEDSYWRSDGHSVGLDQLEAVTWAMGTVADIEGPPSAGYHDKLSTRLEQLQEVFRTDQPDPFGYGIATLLTIIKKIKEHDPSLG